MISQNAYRNMFHLIDKIMPVIFKPFLCKVCNWSGPFPLHTFVKREGMTEQVIFLCPDCSNEVREVK